MNYYRILNLLEEPTDKILTSNWKSQFRTEVFAYKKLSFDIYMFALRTGLQINSAIRVAENVPAFLDLLNVFFQSNAMNYDLYEMLVDDPIRYVSSDELYLFSSNYISDIDKTGLFYDWGKEHYIWEFIWEMVRSKEFPDMPPRMESLFLFDNLDNAIKFKNQYRTDSNKYQTAEIALIEGRFQTFDMNWFTSVPSDFTLLQVQEYARNYWEQKNTTNPITEVLFQGKYKVNQI